LRAIWSGINLIKKMAKKRGGGFSAKGEYCSSWNFLKDSREFIYIAILVFGIFTVIGFFFEDVVNIIFQSLFDLNLRDVIMTFIDNLIRQTEGMGQGELVGFIFFNNLQSSFMGLIFGILFGIFPVFALITNGYLLGFVSASSVKTGGLFTLWRILPHGIFELPALFIALGLGLRLGTFVFRDDKKSFKRNLLESLRVFLLIVLPLLIIAALIEGSLIAFS